MTINLKNEILLSKEEEVECHLMRLEEDLMQEINNSLAWIPMRITMMKSLSKWFQQLPKSKVAVALEITLARMRSNLPKTWIYKNVEAVAGHLILKHTPNIQKYARKYSKRRGKFLIVRLIEWSQKNRKKY